MNKINKIIIGAALFLPAIAFAQQTIGGILGLISGWLTVIIPILMILATVVFLWGVILYVVAGADEDKLQTAKAYIMLGLIGLFVMVVIWGLVRVLVASFGVGGSRIPGGVGVF